jgi:Tol biopolymer transport system component
MKKITICGAVIALCLACASDEEGDGAVLILSGASFPDCGPGNILVFGMSGDLYWCDEYGGNVTRITYTPNDYEKNPAWSPDGEYVAYDAYDRESGTSGIFVVAKAGGEPTQLTADKGRLPAWSPDGQTIAYNAGSKSDIWLVPATGGEPTRLTRRGYCLSPCWSQEGDIIFFSGPDPKNVLGPWFLWYVNRNSGYVAYVWPSYERLIDLALSPGGDWLAAVFEIDPSPYDICLFNVKSGDRYRLTREPVDEGEDPPPRFGALSPTWAEDGTRVFFGSDRYYDPGIYAIKTNR